MDEEGQFAGDRNESSKQIAPLPTSPGQDCRYLVADLAMRSSSFLRLGLVSFAAIFPRQISVPLGESDGGIDRNQDGFVEFFLLFYAVVVVNLVDLGQIVFHSARIPFKPLCRHFLIISHLMNRHRRAWNFRRCSGYRGRKQDWGKPSLSIHHRLFCTLSS